MFVYTMQPVVQPVVLCKRGHTVPDLIKIIMYIQLLQISGNLVSGIMVPMY